MGKVIRFRKYPLRYDVLKIQRAAYAKLDTLWGIWAAMIFSEETAASFAEISHLEWKDVDLTKGMVCIGKGRNRRTIPLTSDGRLSLSLAWENRTGAHVFPSDLRKQFAQAKKEANLCYLTLTTVHAHYKQRLIQKMLNR